MLTEIIGGFDDTILKKLNGAALTTPSSDIDVIKAIGLGIIDPIKNL